MVHQFYNLIFGRRSKRSWLKGTFIAAVLICCMPGLGRAETLSLSTFYPSPFGVYNMLRLVPRDPAFIPACVGVDGLLWINSDGELRLCWGGVETALPEVWNQDDATDKVYLTDIQSGVNPNLQVGIGTASPVAMLHIVDAASTVLRLDSNTTPRIDFFQGVTRRGGIRATAINAFSIADNLDSDRFVLTQTGNVGIGVAAPTVSLQTLQDIRTAATFYSGLSDTTAGNFIISGGGADEGGQINLELPANWDTVFQYWAIDSYQDSFRIFRDAPGPGTPSLFIDTNGNVAFGASVQGINTLTVRGNMLVSTTGAPGGQGSVWAHVYFPFSDEKLKENIRPVKGLDVITRLKGVKFDIKGTGKKGVGLIAQDVEKVLPELVETPSGTNLKSVQYESLVGPLIEALKEQQAQIDALQKEIDGFRNGQF